MKLNHMCMSTFCQVQFVNVSAVFAIQTQGRAKLVRWVRTFRVEYSQDCITFNSLLDVLGNTKVL